MSLHPHNSYKLAFHLKTSNVGRVLGEMDMSGKILDRRSLGKFTISGQQPVLAVLGITILVYITTVIFWSPVAPPAAYNSPRGEMILPGFFR